MDYVSLSLPMVSLVMSTGQARYGPVMLRALWQCSETSRSMAVPGNETILYILFLLLEISLPVLLSFPDLNLFSYHGYPSHLLVTPQVEWMPLIL